MFNTFLVKYGEIGVKGKNRKLFEEALAKQIRRALRKAEGEFEVTRAQGRIYVECLSEYDYEEVVGLLQQVFGIVGICPVCKIADEGLEKLAGDVVDFIGRTYEKKDMTFKVEARRARKSYPVNSMDINCYVGGRILDAFPDMKVDVHHPDVMVYIEIREEIYVYSRILPGPGGMPVGSNGKAMLLLSGGIDSPVAGYMICKRGVKLDAVYFHAPPYTSEQAKEKVIELAHLIARYSGPIALHIVNFTDVQLCIYETCPHDELTIIMRRYMMRIAEHFAKETESYALVTGESLGQVASQTMQSLAVTNEVCEMPVFRPLIGFDKQEIVDVSQRIGTFETSILPYEDCCTIFVAKHPVTKPSAKVIRRSEQKLQGKIEDLVQKAIDTTERIWVD